MAKRFCISPVLGPGSSPVDSWHAAVRDVPQTTHRAVIPSNPDGTPKFNFALCIVSTAILPQVLAVSNLYALPDYPLDARMDGMGMQARQEMDQSVPAYDLDGQGLHLALSYTDASTYREVLQHLGQQFDPTFQLNSLDTLEPEPL